MDPFLVSIVVVTYNSATTIIETLESIRQQTYSTLELIITDDCSTDNTLEICNTWLTKNGNRFTKYKIISSEKNTGVVANCNRGYYAASGTWIKDVAGDDAIYPNAIENLVGFAQLYPDAKIIHSKMKFFHKDLSEDNIIKKGKRIPRILKTNKNPNPHKQYSLLCIINEIGTPTTFIQKNLFTQLGGYDESIPMCEDWPMWLKTTINGYPLYFLNEYTAKYRVSTSSIMGKENKNYFFKRFYQMENLIYQKYIKPYARYDIRFFNRYDYHVRLLLEKCNLNKPNLLAKIIYYTTISPYKLYYKLLSL